METLESYLEKSEQANTQLRNVLRVGKLVAEIADLGKAVPVFGVVCSVVSRIVKIGGEIHNMAECVLDAIGSTIKGYKLLRDMKKKMKQSFRNLESTPRGRKLVGVREKS